MQVIVKVVKFDGKCEGSYVMASVYTKVVSEVICWNKEEIVVLNVIRRVGKF